jgi:hypothetical protein
LRVGGDGRCSSNKTDFVLFTLTVLIPHSRQNRNSNYFTVDDCLSIGVYEGKENCVEVKFFLNLFKKFFNNIGVSWRLCSQ